MKIQAIFSVRKSLKTYTQTPLPFGNTVVLVLLHRLQDALKATPLKKSGEKRRARARLNLWPSS